MIKDNIKTISIIVPCYNEEKNVKQAYEQLKKVTSQVRQYRFEIIFIDNGSLDKTREKIISITKQDKNVKGIFLSRNFGPEASGKAGFDYSTGAAIVAISCDLQDPPNLIPEFIRKWEEGNIIVLGVYEKTKDNFFMNAVRNLFYKFFNSVANTQIPQGATGFGLYDKKILDSLQSLPEKYRFTRGLLSWIGFKKSFIRYTRNKRLRGKSSYNFFRYLKDAERGIFGFSYLALDLMVYGGFLITFLSFIFIVVYLYWVFIIGNPIKASIPTMLAIVFFGGVQLLAISIIGKYIQVIVEETKNRPTYIVEDTINFTR